MEKSFKVELPQLSQNVTIPKDLYEEVARYTQHAGATLEVRAKSAKEAVENICNRLGLNPRIWSHCIIARPIPNRSTT